MKTHIQTELNRIESERRVRVLYAAESGSRAWGFASRDSDFDVRFIYAHERDWYFSIERQRDVIEEPLGDQLDIRGWDLRKTLQLLRKSNPSLLEWLKSPVVYRADPEFVLRFGHLAAEYYSPERCFRHYLHMARGNFREYLRGETVRLKKYFYVLRPLLACRWIEARHGSVPMKFETLVDVVADSPLLRTHIAALLARKRAGDELAEGRRIPVLSDFIESELERLETLALPETAPPEAENLDRFFRDFWLGHAA